MHVKLLITYGLFDNLLPFYGLKIHGFFVRDSEIPNSRYEHQK